MHAAYSQPNYVVSFPAEFVLSVAIDRPAKLNAFHDPLWHSLRAIFDAASTDPDVRVVVLSANGRAFTAGLDLAASGLPAMLAAAGDVARAAVALRRYVLDFQDAVSSLQRCARPVVAALHGVCYGLGVDLAAACDLRVASACARFCVREVDVGLAADLGSLQRLPKVCGDGAWLREVCLTARTFDADEALAHGLVSRVLPDAAACLAAALETARLIASKSPVAVQGTKFLLDHARDHPVEEGLAMTAVWNAAMLQSADVTDAMAGALARKPAKFSKL